ncbi:MAG: molybdate ABC transporter substrate-binding protein [Pseudomonadota bacterium]
MTIRAVFLFVILLNSIVLPVQASERILVFAAASLRDVLLEVGEVYEAQCDCSVTFSFAASSTLARQIEAGAPADIYISANQTWVDRLVVRQLINEVDVLKIAGNRLVIASAAKTGDSFNILLRDRFAMADPKSVPAGIYAKQALEHIGLWERAVANAVFTSNVRLALASIARGDLLSGIVYQSDLEVEPQLHAHYVFPATAHAAIRYYAAPIAKTVQAKGFAEFLTSPSIQKEFLRFGFLPISATQEE